MRAGTRREISARSGGGGSLAASSLAACPTGGANPEQRMQGVRWVHGRAGRELGASLADKRWSRSGVVVEILAALTTAQGPLRGSRHGGR